MPKCRKARRKSISDEEEIEIWNFIYDRVIKQRRNRKVCQNLWEKYIENSSSDYTVEELDNHYQENMMPDLYKTELPSEVILELYKELKIPMEKHVERMLEISCQAFLKTKKEVLISYKFIETPKRSKERVEDNDDTQLVIKASPASSVTNSPVVNITPKNSMKKFVAPSGSNVDVPDDMFVSQELENAIWEYVAENCKTDSPGNLLKIEFWEEFSRRKRLPFSSPYLIMRHFHSMLPNFWKLDIDVEVKLKTMKLYKIELQDEQRKWFLDNYCYNIELEDGKFVDRWTYVMPKRGRPRKASEVLTDIIPVKRSSGIENWQPANHVDIDHNDAFDQGEPSEKSSNGSSIEAKPDIKHKYGRYPFTDKEHEEIWEFLWRKVYDKEEKKPRDVQVLPKGNLLWKEFVRESRSNRTPINLASHYRKIMEPMILSYGLRPIQILHFHKIFGIEIDDDTMRRIETKCGVKLLVENRKLIGWSRQENEEENSIDDDIENEIVDDSNGVHIDENPINDESIARKRKLNDDSPRSSRSVAEREISGVEDEEIVRNHDDVGSLESTAPIVEEQEMETDLVENMPPDGQKDLSLNIGDSNGKNGELDNNPECINDSEEQDMETDIVENTSHNAQKDSSLNIGINDYEIRAISGVCHVFLLPERDSTWKGSKDRDIPPRFEDQALGSDLVERMSPDGQNDLSLNIGDSNVKNGELDNNPECINDSEKQQDVGPSDIQASSDFWIETQVQAAKETENHNDSGAGSSSNLIVDSAVTVALSEIIDDIASQKSNEGDEVENTSANTAMLIEESFTINVENTNPEDDVQQNEKSIVGNERVDDEHANEENRIFEEGQLNETMSTMILAEGELSQDVGNEREIEAERIENDERAAETSIQTEVHAPCQNADSPKTAEESREEVNDENAVKCPIFETTEIISSADNLTEWTKSALMQKCVDVINEDDDSSLNELLMVTDEVCDQYSSDGPISDEKFKELVSIVREDFFAGMRTIPLAHMEKREKFLNNVLDECRRKSWNEESFMCFVSIYKQHFQKEVNEWYSFEKLKRTKRLT